MNTHVQVQFKCGMPNCGATGPRTPADDPEDAWRWLNQHANHVHHSDTIPHRKRYIDPGRTATAWRDRPEWAL